MVDPKPFQSHYDPSKHVRCLSGARMVDIINRQSVAYVNSAHQVYHQSSCHPALYTRNMMTQYVEFVLELVTVTMQKMFIKFFIDKIPLDIQENSLMSLGLNPRNETPLLLLIICMLCYFSKKKTQFSFCLHETISLCQAFHTIFLISIPIIIIKIHWS